MVRSWQRSGARPPPERSSQKSATCVLSTSWRHKVQHFAGALCEVNSTLHPLERGLGGGCYLQGHLLVAASFRAKQSHGGAKGHLEGKIREVGRGRGPLHRRNRASALGGLELET